MGIIDNYDVKIEVARDGKSYNENATSDSMKDRLAPYVNGCTRMPDKIVVTFGKQKFRYTFKRK